MAGNEKNGGMGTRQGGGDGEGGGKWVGEGEGEGEGSGDDRFWFRMYVALAGRARKICIF